jgi:hypothetical protein
MSALDHPSTHPSVTPEGVYNLDIIREGYTFRVYNGTAIGRVTRVGRSLIYYTFEHSPNVVHEIAMTDFRKMTYGAH